MKKVTSIFLALCLIVSLITVPASAGAANGLSVSKTSAKAGDEITLTFQVESVSDNLSGFEYEISFDKDAFELTSYVAPDLAGASKMTSSKNISNNNGKITGTYSGADYGNDIVFTSGFTATMTFTVRASATVGAKSFTLNKCKLNSLADDGYTPIDKTPAAFTTTTNVTVVSELTGTLAITGVTAPAKKAAPDTEITAPANTTAEIKWYKGSDVQTGNFAGDTVYNAVINIKANEGYVFADDVAFTVDGESWTSAKQADGSYNLTKVFDATAGKVLTKIDVTAEPTKTAYVEGQTFDPTGMVVTASYDDSSSAEVTGYTFSNSALTKGQTFVEVSYTENGVTKTANVAVTVVAKAVVSIAATKDDTVIYVGDAETVLKNAITVTATYNDNDSATIDDFTIENYDNTAGNHEVSIEAGGKQTTLKYTVEKKALSPDLFTFTPAGKLIYDGTPKAGTVASTKVGAYNVVYEGEDENVKNAGTYKVYADVKNDPVYVDGKIEIGSFTVAKADVTIDADNMTVVKNVETPIGATTDPAGFTLKYVSADPSKVTVADGKVTGLVKTESPVKVTISFDGTDNYNAASKEIFVTVTDKNPVAVTFGNAEAKPYTETGYALGEQFVQASSDKGISRYEYNDATYATLDALKAVIVKEAGTYTVKAVYESATEYGEATATFIINKANQSTLSFANANTVTYGETLQLSVSGGSGTGAVTYAIKDDTGATGAATITGNVLTATQAGKVTVVATKAGDNNYNAVTAEQEITIAKADAKTLADQTVSVKYTASVDQTYTLTGLGEDITGYSVSSKTGDIIDSWSVNESGVVSFKLESGITVGQTATMEVKVSYKNYEDSYVNVVVSITDRDPSNATVDATFTKSYDGTAVTIADIHATAGVTGTWTWNTEAPVNAQPATTYELTFTPDDQVNYAVETKNVSITINPAKITVKADDKTAKIGDAVPALTYTVSGLCGEDVLGGTVVVAYENAPDMSKVGTVNIIVSGAETPNDNYVVEHVNGVLEITAKSTVVTPVGPSKDEVEDKDDEGETDVTVGKNFSDVKSGDWFYGTVEYVVENGLMNGTSDTSFAPYADTTRAMIVTILWRLEGEPAPLGNCQFVDVPAGAWYAEAVTWAAEKGIVTGLTATEFGPDANITREQFATILWRYAKNYKGYDVSVGEDTNILSYTDAFNVSEYAIPAMQWACGAGLINGIDGALQPAGFANRAQAATILARFCQNYQ